MKLAYDGNSKQIVAIEDKRAYPVTESALYAVAEYMMRNQYPVVKVSSSDPMAKELYLFTGMTEEDSINLKKIVTSIEIAKIKNRQKGNKKATNTLD